MVYNILNTNETVFRVGALIIVAIAADAKKTHAYFIGPSSFSPIMYFFFAILQNFFLC